jgi:hypothetical protein
VTPQVLTRNYPGLATYESGSSKIARAKRHGDAPKSDSEEPLERSAWNVFKEAWTAGDKSVQQTLIVVGTIVVGLVVLFLLFGSVAWLSQMRRHAPRFPVPIGLPGQSIPQRDSRETLEPQSFRYERRAPSAWTRRYE